MRQPATTYELNLDLGSVPISDQGIDGLVWPVSRPELLSVRESFVTDYVDLMRSGWNAGSPQGRIRRVLAVALYMDVLGAYAAWALVRRMRELRIGLRPAKRHRLWSAFIEGVPAAAPFALKLLERGEPYAASRQFLRGLHGVFFGDRNLRRPFSLTGPARRGIVSTASSPLVHAHAASCGRMVSLLSLGHWFAPLDERDLQAYGSALPDQDVAAIVDIIRKAFVRHGETMPQFVENYFSEWIVRASLLSSAYLGRMLASPSRIPRQLWTGTGGNILARILRESVNMTGGRVTGHDHGGGTGFWTTHNRNLIEFDCCDEFVTYSAKQVEGNQRTLRPEVLVQPDPPRFSAVPNWRPEIGMPGKDLDALRRSKAREGGRIRTVMWVSTAYEDDFMMINPLIPGHVLVDFQARGLAALAASGVHVLFKPHPESLPTHPPGFETMHNVRVVTGRFEEVLDEADAFVFDWAKSTTFAIALFSGRPVVWCDTGDEQLFPEARASLAERCRILPISREESGRLRLDGAALISALEEASLLRDSGFVSNYL